MRNKGLCYDIFFDLVFHRRDANQNSNKIYLILINSRIKIDRTLNKPEINDYDSLLL